jgi:hypothetical protein
VYEERRRLGDRRRRDREILFAYVTVVQRALQPVEVGRDAVEAVQRGAVCTAGSAALRTGAVCGTHGIPVGIGVALANL